MDSNFNKTGFNSTYTKFFIYVLLVFTLACNNAQEVNPIETNITDKIIANFQLLVVNEGNFGSGNATISKIAKTDSTLSVENNAYFTLNNEYLGNVGQSITKVNNELWIVVNNSQKIVICDLNLNKIEELTGFNSPRYLVQYEDKVYVSDLFENQLYVVSVAKREIIKKISTDSWNEELLVIDSKLWVTNTDKNTVSVYSTLQDTLIKEIVVTKEPFAIKKDAQNKIWVLCNGGLIDHTEDAYLYQLDSDDLIKIDSFDLSGLKGTPTRLEINNNKIYVLATHVYGLENNTFTNEIDGSNYNFYGLKVTDTEIYLTDAKDFVRKGQLLRYNLNGFNIKDSVDLDIIPGFIYPME